MANNSTGLPYDTFGNQQNITINRINNDIGINQTSPQYDLDVFGSINFTGSLLSNGVDYNTGTSNLYYPSVNFSSNTSSLALATGIWSSNNFVAFSNNIYPRANWASNASSFSSNTAVWSSNNIGSIWRTSNNLIYSLSNVSVMTSNNTGYNLNVLNNGRIPYLDSSNINGTLITLSNRRAIDNPVVLFFTESNIFQVGTNNLLNANSNCSFLWNTTPSHMIFGTNDIERMRITSNGCLGINNSNPAYPLTVTGEALISANLYSLSNLVCNSELIGSNLVMTSRLIKRAYVGSNLANTSNPIYTDNEIIDSSGMMDWAKIKNKPDIPAGSESTAAAGLTTGLGALFMAGAGLFYAFKALDGVVSTSDILKANSSLPQNLDVGDSLSRALSRWARDNQQGMIDFFKNYSRNSAISQAQMIDNPLASVTIA